MRGHVRRRRTWEFIVDIGRHPDFRRREGGPGPHFHNLSRNLCGIWGRVWGRPRVEKRPLTCCDAGGRWWFRTTDLRLVRAISAVRRHAAALALFAPTCCFAIRRCVTFGVVFRFLTESLRNLRTGKDPFGPGKKFIATWRELAEWTQGRGRRVRLGSAAAGARGPVQTAAWGAARTPHELSGTS
jgi:hypothetical protein